MEKILYGYSAPSSSRIQVQPKPFHKSRDSFLLSAIMQIPHLFNHLSGTVPQRLVGRTGLSSTLKANEQEMQMSKHRQLAQQRC